MASSIRGDGDFSQSVVDTWASAETAIRVRSHQMQLKQLTGSLKSETSSKNVEEGAHHHRSARDRQCIAIDRDGSVEYSRPRGGMDAAG